MDLTPNHRLKDLVRVTRHVGEDVPMDKFRTAEFPEILRTEYGEYIGVVTLDGERIEEPMLAFVIDLMKWGYEKLNDYYTLKEPAVDGVIDTPEALSLPYEIRNQFPTSRSLRNFFVFRDELAPGVKKWTPRAKMVKSKTRFDVPTLCLGNRGYREAYPGGTGFDAACIAAVQAGLSIRSWDNPIPNFCVDDTPERIAFLKGRMSAPDFPKIVEDSKWVMAGTSIPHRGIRDYDRTITFDRALTKEQMEVFCEFLSLDNCPGWTGVGMRRDTVPPTYRFGTTHDSSD